MAGRRILIVGGAAGIGKQITEDFCRQQDIVAIADRNAEAGGELAAQLRESGGQASFYTMDVCSWDDSRSAIEQAIRDMGGVDVLVYSAGITRRVPFEQLEWDEWKRTLAVNLTGLFHAAKAVAPAMIQQRSGAIVIIGSGSAITGSGGGVHYAASKGGAFGFMRTLVSELGPYGIRINTVAPRVIESEMLTRLYPNPADLERLKESIPLRRLGTVDDVSNIVQFLSSEASGYIQGQVLICDGGRTYS
ncbi:SDR family NAD(P)-dependent oxidoreductase [Brevibacillus sp. B_LB10_24]|uniref:SDR family NAD(P)-dependent oxidoreductase n=1 Tax=Brevibacillus sp. B_LB10_24 TaxID=3380645 RepID=UPI0038BBF67D